MNTTTNAELAEVASTDIATLPPAMRAAVVLKSEQTRKDLAELVKKSAGILAVLNTDGREEAHRAGMVLKGARVAIEKTGKAAREDATAFSKAVIAEEKALVDLIAPEETRVLALRDSWDEKIEAEKQAKIAAERARVDAICSRIDVIRDLPLRCNGVSATGIAEMIKTLRDSEVTADLFAERLDNAIELKHRTLSILTELRDAQAEAEAAALAAEEARKAEAARIEAERAELARQRAEAAETARLAKIESDRIAAEQAAEAKRLDDQRIKQEAEARRVQEQAAANLRAEREAQELAMRLERERVATEQARVAAELRAAQATLDAARAAHEAKLQLECDHEEALAMNAQIDADRAAELARCTETANAMLTNGRSLALPESYSERDAFIDAGITEYPEDDEIIDMVAAAFDMTRDEAIDRLAGIDYVVARAGVTA
jgi:hypothetical protein